MVQLELFRAAATVAATAALTAHDQLVDTSETDEDVHDSLDLHPGSQEHVNDVPVSISCEPS